MTIEFTQEDIYEVVLEAVRKRGFKTAGIQAFCNDKVIADDAIAMRVEIDKTPVTRKKPATP